MSASASRASRTRVGDPSTPTTRWPRVSRSRERRPSPQPRSSVSLCGGGRSARNWSRRYTSRRRSCHRNPGSCGDGEQSRSFERFPTHALRHGGCSSSRRVSGTPGRQVTSSRRCARTREVRARRAHVGGARESGAAGAAGACGPRKASHPAVRWYRKGWPARADRPCPPCARLCPPSPASSRSCSGRGPGWTASSSSATSAGSHSRRPRGRACASDWPARASSTPTPDSSTNPARSSRRRLRFASRSAGSGDSWTAISSACDTRAPSCRSSPRPRWRSTGPAWRSGGAIAGRGIRPCSASTATRAAISGSNGSRSKRAASTAPASMSSSTCSRTTAPAPGPARGRRVAGSSASTWSGPTRRSRRRSTSCGRFSATAGRRARDRSAPSA